MTDNGSYNGANTDLIARLEAAVYDVLDAGGHCDCGNPYVAGDFEVAFGVVLNSRDWGHDYKAATLGEADRLRGQVRDHHFEPCEARQMLENAPHARDCMLFFDYFDEDRNARVRHHCTCWKAGL